MYILTAALARSSSASIAIYYVLPVLWMASCFHIMRCMVRHVYGAGEQVPTKLHRFQPDFARRQWSASTHRGRSLASTTALQTDLETSQNGMTVWRNSRKEWSNAETGVAVERQSRRAGNVAHYLRHVGLKLRKRYSQNIHVHCEKYPYIRGYFVSSFPHFNRNGSVYTAVWPRASLFRRFTDTKVYGTGYVKMWKARHKISMEIRILFTV